MISARYGDGKGEFLSGDAWAWPRHLVEPPHAEGGRKVGRCAGLLEGVSFSGCFGKQEGGKGGPTCRGAPCGCPHPSIGNGGRAGRGESSFARSAPERQTRTESLNATLTQRTALARCPPRGDRACARDVMTLASACQCSAPKIALKCGKIEPRSKSPCACL